MTRISLFALVPPLEREINLILNNEQISSALNKIHDQTGLVFSYQANLISGASPVTAMMKRKTVREALSIILPKHITYKSRSNYIILKNKPPETNVKVTQISGYVYDQKTEEKVPNVTIFDKESLQSVTTDEYGFYSIAVPVNNLSITINKENYKDTVIAVSEAREKGTLNISIKRMNDVIHGRDSLYLKEKLSEVNALTKKVFKKAKGYINSVNVKDTIQRNFQVSVFPFVGTNHRLSGSVYNHISLNVYGGYARGLNGFEAGGIFNVEKENVRGFQVAGLLNIVGDSLKGTQAAGLINITGNSAEGFQAAGLMNINEGRQKGFQAAGLMNISGKTTGTSAAGMMNIARNVKGVQLAGMANISDTLHGAAIAGMFNKTGRSVNGVQLAGMFNSADLGTTRAQIAGLFNKASFVRGVQIAPFNFADTASGVPLGLLSFVKKGLHQMEISADEVCYTNLSFRTGVQKFYNIVSVGMNFGPTAPLWQIGYGAGTSFRIKNKLNSDVTITGHHLSKGGFYIAASDLYRLYLGLEYKIGKKFSIAGGPTLNWYFADALPEAYKVTYRHIGPSPLYDRTDSDDYNNKVWIGWRCALRFF
jgi:hypothetical protein